MSNSNYTTASSHQNKRNSSMTSSSTKAPKTNQKHNTESLKKWEEPAPQPTTSLGLGGMSLAILLVVMILCSCCSTSATAIPLLAANGEQLVADARAERASLGELAQALVSPNYEQQQRELFFTNDPASNFVLRKRNAELINGLIGMDLDRLSAMGKKRKRGNAELINGLLGMDLDRLSSVGRRRR